MATILGTLADDVVAVLQQQSTQEEIQSAISAGEVPIETALVAAIQSVKPPGGILGLLWPIVAKELEAAAAGLATKYGPAQLTVLLVQLATNEAKALGG